MSIRNGVGFVLWAWLLLTVGGQTILPAAVETVSLDELQRLVVLENGRKMPLDSLAVNALRQISGRSSYRGQAALVWLARVLFTPEQTYRDEIFRVNEPALLLAIGIFSPPRPRYSCWDLSGALAPLEKLARQAADVNDKSRSPVENEALQLYERLDLYFGLLGSFQWALPDESLTVTDPEARRYLDLTEKQIRICFLDLAERSDRIASFAASLSGGKKTNVSPGQREIMRLTTRIDQLVLNHQGRPLRVIPTLDGGVGADGEEWLNPWEVLATGGLKDDAGRREITALVAAQRAFRNHDDVGFNAGLNAFNASVRGRAGGRLFAAGKIGLEIFYNRLDAFVRASWLYGGAVVLLVLALFIGAAWLRLTGIGLLAAGFVLHSGGQVLRMIIGGRPPVTNLFETFIFVAWVAVLLGMLLEASQKKSLGLISGGMAGIFLLFIAGRYTLNGDTMGMLVAVLNTNLWLAVHVATITSGYAGCVIAGIIGHFHLLQRLAHCPDRGRLASSARSIRAALVFGLVFTFLGTAMGGVWADQSWGRFWGWDPKENGALLIIIWLAILLHARRGGIISDLGMAAGSIIALLIVALAWLGVNVLGVGLHSYGFISGVARGLLWFLIVDLIFLAVTLSLARRRSG